MKILDRYIAKNFLVGYVIAFLRIYRIAVIIELFVNLDELRRTRTSRGRGTDKAHCVVLSSVPRCIFATPRASSPWWPPRFHWAGWCGTTQLVAMIASGVSRQSDIVGPILALVIFFTALAVADQELLITAISGQTRPGRGRRGGQASLCGVVLCRRKTVRCLCSPKYDATTATLDRPTILTRRPLPSNLGSGK
jgi:hypothetical protein